MSSMSVFLVLDQGRIVKVMAVAAAGFPRSSRSSAGARQDFCTYEEPHPSTLFHFRTYIRSAVFHTSCFFLHLNPRPGVGLRNLLSVYTRVAYG